MKRLSLYILSFTILISSCEKLQDTEHPENIDPMGYIMFFPGINTKAPIKENMKDPNAPFGVLGYNYSKETNWATARVLATPDVFYNVNVNYSNNIFTYQDNDTDLKPWSSVDKFSFFAYYPMASSSNNITISSSNALDVPIVSYEFPFPASTSTVMDVPASTAISDLMTASAIDITSVGSGYVNLNFEHRLFCIDVIVRNYNSNPVTINNLTLTLTGLKYRKITIPLDKNDTKVDVTTDGTAPSTTTFKITNKTVVVPGYTDSKNLSYSISKNGSDNGGYLFLIPQETRSLTGSVSWDEINDFDNVNTTFTSNTALEEGKRYVVVINIAGESITIAIIEEESWDSKDVNIEFN